MHTRAFSLVELSIVLVILGLLTGGILAGQSLIRAAEMNSVVSDYARYRTAVQTFQEKYMALPGDMTTATKFWGAADGSTGTTTSCYTTAATAGSKATCNGNGNGGLFHNDPNCTDDTICAAPEWFRAWQHLANAGLVEGSYTGVAAAAPRGAQPGVNVPTSKISNVGFTLISLNASATNGGVWVGRSETFAVGKLATGSETANPAFTPAEAWNLDLKTDDGKPNTGLVRDGKGFSSCHTGSGSAWEYAVSTKTVVCCLYMAINHPGGDGS